MIRTTKSCVRLENVAQRSALALEIRNKNSISTGVKTYAFFNNHYAGFAPGSVKLFEDLWEKE